MATTIRGRGKCNIDPALFKEDHWFGVGMCPRDARDHFLKAKIARYNGVPLTNEVKDCGPKKLSLPWWNGYVKCLKLTKS